MQRATDSIVLSVQFLLNKNKTIQPVLFSVIVTTKNAGFLQIVKTIVRIFSRQIDFKDFWGRTYFMCGPNFLSSNGHLLVIILKIIPHFAGINKNIILFKEVVP
jgi:hypothetical protein